MGALTERLHQLQIKFNSPGLAMQLGYSLATALLENAPVDTGATASAVSRVTDPERTATGWSIGVGDKTKTGDESTPAPRGTLRAFYNYLEGTGRDFRYSNWRGLSKDNKTLLAQGRRAGLFGGRGIDYANYMWIQNSGNAEAGITGTHFLEHALEQWRGQASQIIQDYLSG